MLTEFGVVALINKLLVALMGVLYGLPGAASIGIVTTYLSDNPAILTLADDPSFRRYFKRYQLPALTNLGTAFGMGAIISAFMLGLQLLSGGNFGLAVLVGNLGAVFGSIVSTRLMLRFTRRVYGTDRYCDTPDGVPHADLSKRTVRPGGIGARLLGALTEGGATGVKMGVEIIPGVLLICTFVLLLTKGPGEGGLYTGALRGVAALPAGQEAVLPSEASVRLHQRRGHCRAHYCIGRCRGGHWPGAGLLSSGLAGPQDVAVFTAMCMCWSGYLSTHVAMMASLKCSGLTGRAIGLPHHRRIVRRYLRPLGVRPAVPAGIACSAENEKEDWNETGIF